MKDTLSTIAEFLKQFEKHLEAVHIEQNFKGQVQKFEGYTTTSTEFPEKVAKTYRKQLVSSDFRFAGTEMLIEGNSIFIVRK